MSISLRSRKPNVVIIPISKFIFTNRQEANLTKELEVENLFRKYKPNYVIHTAAKVGGIQGNMNNPAEYFYENIIMNSFIIHYSHLYKVEKLLVFSSVCAMPFNCKVFKEEEMHNGNPYLPFYAYAYAKRMCDIQIEAYKKQYGINNYCSIIASNIFGKNDFYNIEDAHVIPSLIHKIYISKSKNIDFKVWGDGSAKREFIYAKDLSLILMRILQKEEIPQKILVSSDKQISIKNLVKCLCRIADFQGNIVWQSDKPVGVKKRKSDLTTMNSLIGNFDYTEFYVALKDSYNWFVENHVNARK